MFVQGVFLSKTGWAKLQENVSDCLNYIPDTTEYYEALGWVWILFVIIGCGTCILLYTLFLDVVVSSFKNVHSTFRNSVIWISSVYPIMTFMTIIGFIIPRSQQVCYTVKLLYMMIGISKFADFTTLLYGSEEVMLWVLKNSKLKFRAGPLCCCCLCLPRIGITKRRLRVILTGIRQLPFTQFFFMITVLILESANQVVVGSLNPRESYLWLNLFNVATSLTGVYCLNLISAVSHDHLQRYSYTKLSFVLKALILITKSQSFIFNTLAYYGIFPCVPPISHVLFKQTVENYLYIVEMMTFGTYSYRLYSKTPLSTANPTIVHTDYRGNTLPHHTAYIASLTNYGDEHGYSFPGNDFLDNDSAVGGERTESQVQSDTQSENFSGGFLAINNEELVMNSNRYQQFH